MHAVKGTALALSLLALALGASVTQAATFTPGPLIEASSVNPLSSCAADSSGTNFADSEVEPWLGIDPTDSNNLIGVYQQDRYSDGGSKGSVAATSSDGGATWTQAAIPTNTRCTGGHYQRASDPWVSFGPDGVAHSMSLVTDPDDSAGFGDNGMVYNRSTDGGATWEAAQMLIEDTDPNILNDKNSITADPNDPNFVYAVWDRIEPAGSGAQGPAMLARTTNGGASWEPAKAIYATDVNKQTLGNQVVVEPASAGGSVFDFFSDITNNPSGPNTDPIGLSYIRSGNRGATWTSPANVADQLPMSLSRADSVIDTESATCPDDTKNGACPIRAGDGIPAVAVNRSNGDLYAVWMDARFSNSTHDAIALSQSTNGGVSWSDPIQVNQTPASEPADDQQAFTPSVHVLDDGTVAVSYFDFRNNTPDTATLETDRWAAHCHPASADCADPASWTEETRLTASSFNIRTAPFARGYFVGDYMGLASDPGGQILSLFGMAGGTGPSSVFLGRLGP